MHVAGICTGSGSATSRRACAQRRPVCGYEIPCRAPTLLRDVECQTGWCRHHNALVAGRASPLSLVTFFIVSVRAVLKFLRTQLRFVQFVEGISRPDLAWPSR